jgi:uncharacterized protein involved in exopolysaccharide biosynthesis
MSDLSPKDDAAEDEISIRDLWLILWAQRYMVLAAPLLTAAIAAVLVMRVKPQWEATSIIQIGQVWQVATPLESPSRTVERMKLPPFKVAVLSGLGVPATEDDPIGSLYSDSLKVKVIPNTDLVELRLRAFSREDARRWAEATVKQLQSVHKKLAEPLIARLTQQQTQVQQQIQRIRTEKERLLKNAELKSDIGPGNRFAESVLLSNFLLQKDTELRAVELQHLALEEQLDPAKTYPTSLLDKVYVPAKRAYPKRTLTVVLAGAVGLFVGVLGAFLLNALRGGDKLPKS